METQETLIYGYDPLCGWCFAFRPTMHAITAAYPDLPVTVVYGGLVVGARVQPVSASRDYLIKGLAQVARTAGVQAGPNFYNGLLAQGTYISNSEPPCRAVWTMQQLAPAPAAYRFADALPQTYYGDGLPLDDEDVLGGLAEAHGTPRDDFVALWQSEAAKQGTQAAFQQARQIGIASYPTLLYQRGNAVGLVARGFATPADAVATVAALRGAEVAQV